MGYLLRSGVTFCTVAGRAVFLDARQDRYFCLAPAAESTFLRLIAGGTAPAAAAALDRLVVDGLLQPVAGPALPTPCVGPPDPTTSLCDTALPRARAGSVLAGSYHRLAVAAALRWRGFATALSATARRKPPIAGPTLGDAALPNLAPAFVAAQWIDAAIGAHDQCLPRSLALARQLYAAGQPVQVVIGVNLQPFKAHCWVQAGAILVNERVEIARSFTPILVI